MRISIFVSAIKCHYGHQREEVLVKTVSHMSFMGEVEMIKC